jgi:hypothetical protein
VKAIGAFGEGFDFVVDALQLGRGDGMLGVGEDSRFNAQVCS